MEVWAERAPSHHLAEEMEALTTLSAARDRVAELLETELEAAAQENRDLAHEVKVLRETLKEESDSLWRMSNY